MFTFIAYTFIYCSYECIRYTACYTSKHSKMSALVEEYIPLVFLSKNTACWGTRGKQYEGTARPDAALSPMRKRFICSVRVQIEFVGLDRCAENFPFGTFLRSVCLKFIYVCISTIRCKILRTIPEVRVS